MTGGTQPHQAAAACRALGPAWYLPSGGEWQTMLANLANPGEPLAGTFTTLIGSGSYDYLNSYWTSTESAQSAARVVRFDNGAPLETNGNFFKNIGFYVRCARK